MAHPTKGFASLNPIDRRKIASLGGKAAHAKGTAHVWSLEEAREQGRRGGLAKKARQAVPAPVVADTPDGDVYAQLSKLVA